MHYVSGLRAFGIVMLMLMAAPLVAQEAADMEGNFLADLDVPLPEGLEEVVDQRMVFDSPQGRLIQAEAQGVVSVDAVMDFYGQSLPALGWLEIVPMQPCSAEAVACVTGLREGERLQIAVLPPAVQEAGPVMTTVTYSLSPYVR